MTLAGNLDAAACGFERRIDDVAVAIVARARDEITEVRELEAPEIWEAIRDITRRSRRSQAEHLRRDRRIPKASPAPEIDAAALAARGGISLPACLKSYRIGHTMGRDAWLDAIDELGLDERSWKACVRAVSRFVDDYDDRIMELFTEEHSRAQEYERRGGTRRIAAIRRVLEGLTDELSDLDYDLEHEHVAIVACGGNARKSIHRIATTLGRELLFGEPATGLCWAWLGGSSVLGDDAFERLRRFAPSDDSRLAIGRAGWGPDGFRQSHNEAGSAHMVALRRPGPMTFYDDVSLEALALRDERVAREFMASVLGHLEADDKLRETVRHYFACSQNAASTAAALQVHEQTVARRLKAVEEKIGRPLNERRAELELALRLEKLLRARPSLDTV